MMTTSISYLLIGLVVCSVSTNQLLANDNHKKIDQIKVAYLANFIRFTLWEKDEHKDSKKPLIITIVGDPSFIAFLNAAFPEGTFLDRPILIQNLPFILDKKKNMSQEIRKQLLSSHVIYLRNDNTRDHQEIVSLSSKPEFLYIADLPGMAKSGGMIEMCKNKTRVIFKVNTHAIRNAKLQVSSKVLRLGIPVNPNN